MHAEYDDLLAFLQSAHEEAEHGADPVDGSPEGLAGWLVSRGLAPVGVEVAPEDVTRARHLRAALNSLLALSTGAPPDPRAASAIRAVTDRAPLYFAPGDRGTLVLEASGRDVDRAFAGFLVALYHAEMTGDRPRLKLCRKCGWAFYDASKNRSRVWCDMASCGSQEKARAYRRRKAACAAPGGRAG